MWEGPRVWLQIISRHLILRGTEREKWDPKFGNYPCGWRCTRGCYSPSSAVKLFMISNSAPSEYEHALIAR